MEGAPSTITGLGVSEGSVQRGKKFADLELSTMNSLASVNSPLSLIDVIIICTLVVFNVECGPLEHIQY